MIWSWQVCVLWIISKFHLWRIFKLAFLCGNHLGQILTCVFMHQCSKQWTVCMNYASAFLAGPLGYTFNTGASHGGNSTHNTITTTGCQMLVTQYLLMPWPVSELLVKCSFLLVFCVNYNLPQMVLKCWNHLKSILHGTHTHTHVLCSKLCRVYRSCRQTAEKHLTQSCNSLWEEPIQSTRFRENVCWG